MSINEKNLSPVAIKPLFLRKSFRFIERTLAIIGLISIIYHFGFNISRITSNSMTPTLKVDERTGVADYVLTEKFTYHFRKPHRWELVMYHTNDEYQMQVMKRVAALLGETITLKDKWVLINGQFIDKPSALNFLNYYPYGNLHKGRSVCCKEGYFVMGDDSKDSLDSRYDGVLKPDRIEGRPWLIVWPLSRFGFINP